MTSLIDAANFPSIIDAILQEATFNYNASSLRLVCKDWKARVDRCLAKHIEVVEFWIQISSMPPYFRGLLGRADVGFAVRSRLRPGIHFGLSSNPLYYSLEVGKDPLRELLPDHLLRAVEILDYSLGTDHVFPSLGYKTFLRFPRLHTVRLRFDFAHLQYIQHVDRVIYKDLPVWTVDESQPNTGCTDDECTRSHVRKIVVNVTLPECDDSTLGGRPLPFKQCLEDVVLIFHPWPLIPRRIRAFTGEYSLQDLRFTARAIAARAMAAGARVTIVNVDQRDLRSGEMTGNFPDDDNPEEELEYLIRADLRSFNVGNLFGRAGQIRFLSTEQYVEEVGAKEFEIESNVKVRNF